MNARRRLIIAAVLGPTAAVVLGLAVSEAAGTTPWPGPLEFVRMHPWFFLIPLTALSIVLSLLALSIDKGRPLSSIANHLAVSVRLQWSGEVRRLDLHDPYPISVRWVQADADLFVEWPALVELGSADPDLTDSQVAKWARGPAALAGEGEDLADVLDRVPTGRLVVLGEPGAGKTILLVRLVLRLHGRRRDGGAVPILMSLASWDPEHDDLDTWIESWLITHHPALARRRSKAEGKTDAGALWAQRMIIPLLDGLDEIPDALRARAIERMNRALVAGQRLVLASRTKEYDATVRAPGSAGVQLTGAAGVSLCPLDSQVVARYLKDSSGGRVAAARWSEVLTDVATEQPSLVGEAVRSPLMASLARTIYNPRPQEPLAAIPASPKELLDRKRFPNTTAVVQHLLDQFIPAAYRPHPIPSLRSRWRAAEARKWLTFIARDLEHRQGGTTDLAWWRLAGAIPNALAGLTAGLLAAVVGFFGLPFPIGLGTGLTISVLVSSAVGLTARLLGGQSEQERLTRGLAGGLLGGLAGAVGGLMVLGDSFRADPLGSSLAGGILFGIAAAPIGRFSAGLIGGTAGGFYGRLVEEVAADYALGLGAQAVNGLGVGLAVGVAAGLAFRKTSVREPAKGVHWSWPRLATALACGLIFGFGTWIQIGSFGGLVVGLAGAVAGILAGALSDPTSADLKTATVPRSVFVRDRSTFLLCFLGLGLSVGLTVGLGMFYTPDAVTGLPNEPRMAVGVALTNFLVVGLAFALVQALWGPFVLARFWLAATRRLPWRLMTFLDDAHTNRDVLRQSGAVYQFRHADVQRRLASSFTTNRN